MTGGWQRKGIGDVDALLLSALGFLEQDAQQRCLSVGTLPRHAWALTVLTEQLISAFDPLSAEGRSLSTLTDPQRGVVSRRVTEAFDRLAIGGYVEPVGVGERAAWRLAPDQRWMADRCSRSVGDIGALQRAAQRTLAIVDAWSKTFRASVPARSGTSTSSAARRQPRPA
jgi:hypothetical protein